MFAFQLLLGNRHPPARSQTSYVTDLLEQLLGGRGGCTAHTQIAAQYTGVAMAVFCKYTLHNGAATCDHTDSCFVSDTQGSLPPWELGTGVDRAGSRVTAWSSSTSLPRPQGGHSELRSSSVGAVPAVSPAWPCQPRGGCVDQKLLTITSHRRLKMMPPKAQLHTSNAKFLWTIQRRSFKEEAIHITHILPSAPFPLKTTAFFHIIKKRI